MCVRACTVSAACWLAHSDGGKLCISPNNHPSSSPSNVLFNIAPLYCHSPSLFLSLSLTPAPISSLASHYSLRAGSKLEASKVRKSGAALTCDPADPFPLQIQGTILQEH